MLLQQIQFFRNFVMVCSCLSPSSYIIIRFHFNDPFEKMRQKMLLIMEHAMFHQEVRILRCLCNWCIKCNIWSSPSWKSMNTFWFTKVQNPVLRQNCLQIFTLFHGSIKNISIQNLFWYYMFSKKMHVILVMLIFKNQSELIL